MIRLTASPAVPLDPAAAVPSPGWEPVSFRGYPLAPPKLGAHPLYSASKRLMDIWLSLVLVVLSMPLVLLAAAALFLATRQSPLLLQRRVGHCGRQFCMLKLRTMRKETSEEQPLQEGILVAKSADDVRVTRIGRMLRRSSIDELPQLLNVLLGQMSLVGPRPSLPIEVARYPHSWRRRLDVKPGLTGLWQVSGRSEVLPRRRTAMDRRYIRRCSLSFDCLILLRTVWATFSMRGAW